MISKTRVKNLNILTLHKTVNYFLTLRNTGMELQSANGSFLVGDVYLQVLRAWPNVLDRFEFPEAVGESFGFRIWRDFVCDINIYHHAPFVFQRHLEECRG